MIAGKYMNWKYLKVMNVYCPVIILSVFTMSFGTPPNNSIIEITIVIFISQIKTESTAFKTLSNITRLQLLYRSLQP